MSVNTCMIGAFCVNESKTASGPTPPPQRSAGQKLPVVYACSGCSDAGELADRTARLLSQRNLGQMSCLAGIGGRVRSLVAKAEQAGEILVIDGCPLNCARKTLELAGFKNFQHLELHRLGFRKGSCPVTPERLETAVAAAAVLVQKQESLSTAPQLQERVAVMSQTFERTA